MMAKSFGSGSAPPAPSFARLSAAGPSAPSASPAPRAPPASSQQQSGETKSQSTDQSNQSSLSKKSDDASDAADWTTIPKRMNSDFEKLDTDSALRPTIVKVGPTWDRSTQKGLLSKPVRNRSFDVGQQKTERNKTFDLLDALTRSGVMAVETGASLHVVLCATHCFDKSLMNTIVQNNVNPIEKIERSSLIMASTIHQLPASAMIKADRVEDVKKYSPMLFRDGKDVLDEGADRKVSE